VELDQLQQIIQLLKAEGLSEITVQEGDQLITVKQEIAVADVRPAPPLAPAAELQQVPEEAEDALSLCAPLVGTFYRRPTPDAEPFVSSGDIVSPGDTLCVIEAMKVMNEINAEEPGRVRQVLVEDGDAVEYGQPLFTFDRL